MLINWWVIDYINEGNTYYNNEGDRHIIFMNEAQIILIIELLIKYILHTVPIKYLVPKSVNNYLWTVWRNVFSSN